LVILVLVATDLVRENVLFRRLFYVTGSQLLNELILQNLDSLSVIVVLLLQLSNLVGVVLNNVKLFLNVKFLLLNFYFSHHFIVIECQHLLLEHFDFIAEAL